MPVDGANLQGANVRQVVVQADAAAQSLRPVPPTDSVVRPLAHLGERLLADRNQTDEGDLYVQRQEDDAPYSAGDALNGNGRYEQEQQENRPRHGKDEADDDNEDSVHGESPWSELGDPHEAQERLLKALAALPYAHAAEVFRSMDRSMLTGLLLPGERIGAVRTAMATYQKQSMLVQTAPEAFRMAVHGALGAAEVYASSKDGTPRETARKLVSLARQAVRSESDAGRELSAFLDEALLDVSRANGEGALRAVTLLAIVDTAISHWREGQNVGTVLPWSLL